MYFPARAGSSELSWPSVWLWHRRQNNAHRPQHSVSLNAGCKFRVLAGPQSLASPGPKLELLEQNPSRAGSGRGDGFKAFQWILLGSVGVEV